MICGFLVNFVTNFYVIVICFVAFICCMVCSSIVMAVAVNAYPTNYRAMATSFIILFGRLGSANGSSVIGLLLQNHCTLIFYVFGGVLISKCAGIFVKFITINMTKLKLSMEFFFRLCFGLHNDKNKTTIAANTILF